MGRKSRYNSPFSLREKRESPRFFLWESSLIFPPVFMGVFKFSVLRGSIFLDFVNLLVHFRIDAVGGKISGDGIKLLVEHFYLEIYEFDLFT